ncbi:MAG: DUF420 domain-containing protein [Planctomycetia bacterium]|jgi:putative membrane protein|nr:DUF420 domain-containing protein [Planctomycetia bacterium]
MPQMAAPAAPGWNRAANNRTVRSDNGWSGGNAAAEFWMVGEPGMAAMAAGDAATAALPGIDGFLGTRASFGMDVVVVGLFALLPVLALSVLMVRRGRYQIHKALQIFIMTALLAAIIVFEVDIRLISDWRVRAAASSYWPVGVGVALGIHLIFAVSTLVLLLWAFIEALLRFPKPPVPGSHSPQHRRIARWAAADLLATAITGGIFYCLAFV